MALRADARAFVPVAVRKTAPQVVHKGDQLIQQLADAMAPAMSQAFYPPPPSPVIPPQCQLPASGLFCPYCCHGFACVFHSPLKTSELPTPREAKTKPYSETGPWPLSAVQAAGKLNLARIRRGAGECQECARPGECSCRIRAPPGLEPFKARAFAMELEDWTDASTSESHWTERSNASGASYASTGASPFKPAPNVATCVAPCFQSRHSGRAWLAR